MFLKVLEIKFHIIVFSEIGAWSIGTVEHLLPNHDFHFVLLRDNYFGGLGIYIHKDIFDVQIMDELSIQKSSRCSKCVTAILSGDISIDLIKFNLEDNYQYVSTVMSYGYLPYITLLTRIIDFSAICIDHIFIRDTS